MMLRNKILGLLLIAVLSACTQDSFRDTASVQLIEFLASHKEISATYQIETDKEVILKGAQGYFDRDRKTGLPQTQKMPIASGTKQMTAALIMKLQERGMLTTSDYISKFLPADSGWWPNNEMPEWANKVTVHHLLTHTSGVAEYIPALKFDMSLGHEKIKHLISEYAAKTPLTHEPGAEYAYTNTGYFYLGVIIEQLTGKDLASVFKQELFEPIGMHDTHMASFEEAIQFQQEQTQEFPKRYFVIPTGGAPQYMPAKVDFMLVPFSDGGVVSTVADLVKWNKAFHNKKVVSDHSYKLMTTAYNDAHDMHIKDVKTGYGVYIHKLPTGQTVYYHAGRAVAIRSEHGYIPESNLYFAILSNIMVYETPDMQGKIDYSVLENQIDIGFLRSQIWMLPELKK